MSNYIVYSECIGEGQYHYTIVGELVRCEECKWWGDIGCAIRIVDESDKPKADDYCSFGERREDDKEAD